MKKLILTSSHTIREAIRWQLYNESLQERLIEMALNEAATDNNAASLAAEVYLDHDTFVVEVRVERHPVLACICGKCEKANHYFRCESCGHDTPWCRGADDQYPDLCDDCAVKEAT